MGFSVLFICGFCCVFFCCVFFIIIIFILFCFLFVGFFVIFTPQTIHNYLQNGQNVGASSFLNLYNYRPILIKT